MIEEKITPKLLFHNWRGIGTPLSVLLSWIIIVLSMSGEEHFLELLLVATTFTVVLAPYMLNAHIVISELILGGLFALSIIAARYDGGIYYASGWSLLLFTLILPYYINRCIVLCFFIKYHKLFTASVGKNAVVKTANYYLQFGNKYVVEIEGNHFDAVSDVRITAGETIIVKEQRGTYFVVGKEKQE